MCTLLCTCTGVDAGQGGGSLVRGFAARLTAEVRAAAPRHSRVRLVAPADRLFSAFAGGSVLACLSSTFRSVAVSRGDYFELGAAHVARRTL